MGTKAQPSKHAIIILATESDDVQGLQPAAINAELFSRGKDNIELLLGLLKDEPAGVADFYVRYHTVQLLTSLAAISSYRVQEVRPLACQSEHVV